MRRDVAYYYHPEVGLCHFGDQHPMRPFRIYLTHDLIKNFDLLNHMDSKAPQLLRPEEFLTFHSEDYIEYLMAVKHDSSTSDCHANIFNFCEGDDCPVIDGLWEFCQIQAGGSVDGATSLLHDNYQVAINWAGGLHHAKQREASGFCHVNDCVLAILELLKFHQRVLYVDIDVHHGDGVEEAFYTTPRVLTVSFHKHGQFFPGSGAREDIGAEEGWGYSVNVPLRDGLRDDSFKLLFESVLSCVKEQYDPQAVVLQCGADSLAGDRIGPFNLTITGHSFALQFLRKWNLPLLLLGGGGYSLRNVPRCWSAETAAVLGMELPDTVPSSSVYLNYSGPSQGMAVTPLSRNDHNDYDYIKELIRIIKENLREWVSPVCTAISANIQPPQLSLRSHVTLERVGDPDKHPSDHFPQVT